MRGRVVSEASDEQRAALSSDPTIRNAVSSGHFYFYSAVSAFCSSLCSRFLLFPESSAAEESGEMHAFRCCRRQEHELLPLPPSVRVSPLINSLLRMSIRDIKSPLRKTPDILTGKMKKLFFLRGWTGPCFDPGRTPFLLLCDILSHTLCLKLVQFPANYLSDIIALRFFFFVTL